VSRDKLAVLQDAHELLLYQLDAQLSATSDRQEWLKYDLKGEKIVNRVGLRSVLFLHLISNRPSGTGNPADTLNFIIPPSKLKAFYWQCRCDTLC
jgi:hypothetical protein